LILGAEQGYITHEDPNANDPTELDAYFPGSGSQSSDAQHHISPGSEGTSDCPSTQSPDPFDLMLGLTPYEKSLGPFSREGGDILADASATQFLDPNDLMLGMGPFGHLETLHFPT